MDMDLLKKLRHLAVQNAFNEKQTADFINLVESGTSIDDAIDMIEEGISENKPVKEGVSTDKFNEEIVLAMHKLNDDLESLINKLGYDVDEDISGGCAVVSFWITHYVLVDYKEEADNFYEYLVKKAPNTKVMCDAYASTFLSLTTYFETWIKNRGSGYDLGSEVLHTTVRLGDGSFKFPYEAVQCGRILEFLTEQVPYMIKKQQSLREKYL
jgi:hypothetical protein